MSGDVHPLFSALSRPYTYRRAGDNQRPDIAAFTVVGVLWLGWRCRRLSSTSSCLEWDSFALRSREGSFALQKSPAFSISVIPACLTLCFLLVIIARHKGAEHLFGQKDDLDFWAMTTKLPSCHYALDCFSSVLYIDDFSRSESWLILSLSFRRNKGRNKTRPKTLLSDVGSREDLDLCGLSGPRRVGGRAAADRKAISRTISQF